RGLRRGERGAAGDRRDRGLAGQPLPAGEELTMATATQPQHPEVVEERAQPTAPTGRRSRRPPWALVGPTLGGPVSLSPFYYMGMGALKREPNSSISGAF